MLWISSLCVFSFGWSSFVSTWGNRVEQTQPLPLPSCILPASGQRDTIQAITASGTVQLWFCYKREAWWFNRLWSGGSDLVWESRKASWKKWRLSRDTKAVYETPMARRRRRVFQAKSTVQRGHGWWKGNSRDWSGRQCEMRLEKSSGDRSGRAFKAMGRTSVFIPRTSGTQWRTCGLAAEAGERDGEPYAWSYRLNRVPPSKDMLKS